MLKKLMLATTALLATLPTAAQAKDYLFTFTGFGGAPSGAGAITTSDALNAVNGYDITYVGGTFGGSAITGLLPNPTQPFPSGTPINTYDNVLFPGSALKFDRYGIAFLTGATINNIFDSAADGGTPPAGSPYGLITSNVTGFGQLQLTAVPEASTWAMMIVGMGAMGFAMRRRSAARTTVRFA